jgi:peptide chain release factor 2
LYAKLYALEHSKQETRQSEKREIGWGSQTRSYVVGGGRAKNLRTNIEVRNTQKVLEDDIDFFFF